MPINNITTEIQNMILYDKRHIKTASLLTSLNNISYPSFKRKYKHQHNISVSHNNILKFNYNQSTNYPLF